MFEAVILTLIAQEGCKEYEEKNGSRGALMILAWKDLSALLNSVQKFIEIQGWQLLTLFICLHNQLKLSSFNSIFVQMSKKCVHQIGSKNKWLLLSVTFTAKLELLFVLTFENAFS